MQTTESPQYLWLACVLRVAFGCVFHLPCQGFLFCWFFVRSRLEMANKAGRMFLAVQGMRRVVG
jgi:hypothetical protein